MIRFPHWPLPPDAMALADDEVHVWRVYLNKGFSDLERLASILTAEEREKAGRFFFEEHRREYVVSHSILRYLLGRYVEIAPDRLRFRLGEYGKPALAVESGGGWLRFNLSHSHGIALYAIARNREVGVDVERIQPDFAGEQIAERFFSSEEIRALRLIPGHLRDEAFFNCWTRKEAFIKAKGEGLSMPLDSFDVSLAPGEPARLIATRADSDEASRWTLRELSPSDGYVGAVAAEGADWRLKLIDFPELS
ncbi:MAG TPA: 4'-phosphopantetheinyl transferase superfamily protein [Blastocatellia bacterium]|nr:4'-phosphopantetheinyl transferase superfamily protein [Blastocatellia bacterium]